ncbi:glycosyltransferase family 4 protein [Aestuariivivens insulae]|uniref:glycosyltransferase family 4 protein n=1 Tax=Aestuariivivens insulae TaxID=1621988 RepID=UPI001F56CD9E|nr:glycosyltransferase [Aestuariivivens insulae]
MKLAIISHTEHYMTTDGTVVGLGATVTEINHLLEVFDEIFHVAMLHSGDVPSNMLPYTSGRIKFIPIPAVGGHGLWDKLLILKQAPRILYTVGKALKQCDYFQFRAPTGIGVFVIPYLMCCSVKQGWFKYAGNWGQAHPKFSYRFQRWLLKLQHRAVTINGVWEHQPKHCLTFENPCLTLDEVAVAQQIVLEKQLANNRVDFCFVGRIEEAKGIGILFDALDRLSPQSKSKIGTVHIVGDGRSIGLYKHKASAIDLNIVFHGLLPRNAVHAIYMESHAIVLPSASEGFPKVIAEAMNYGCMPIVSNISAIGYYIRHLDNGFLLDSVTVENLVVAIEHFLGLSNTNYMDMIRRGTKGIEKFTYSYYNGQISSEILLFGK